MPGVWLDLVGLRIDLSECDADTRALLRETWSEFLRDSQPDGMDLRIRAVSDAAVLQDEPSPEPEIRRDGEVWHLLRYDFDATWDARTSRVDVRYAAQMAAFSSFLRVLLSIVLRKYGGVLLHAASVRAADGVVLFPGVSGTGKSTIASLASPRGILSDEISALRPTADGLVRAYPTPFWGDLERKRAADAGTLSRIVILKRGVASPSLEPAPRAEASAALLEGALYFDVLAIAEKRDFIASVQVLAERTACYRLRFDLPSNPWSLLDPLEAPAPSSGAARDSSG